MADIQDSSGLPLSGATGWQTHFSKAQMRLLFAIARKVFANEMAESFRSLGTIDANNQAKIRDLESQIGTLRVELKEVTEYAHQLRALVQESEKWKEDVLSATTAAKADVQTIQHTIDRLNWLVDVVQFLAKPLDTFNVWLTELLARIHRLDERRFSRKDGQDITELTDRRERR
jgi:predicted  nucleic acid-binding Zn-ribbon protein